MPIGHQAAAFACVEINRPKRVEQAHELATRAAGTAAADHERLARRPEELHRRGHAARIGRLRGALPWMKVFVEL